MTEKSKEDDVFEFLESLPDAKGQTDSSNNVIKEDKENMKENRGDDSKQGNEEIMDFLDELEKSNLLVSNKEKKVTNESLKEEEQKKQESNEKEQILGAHKEDADKEIALNDPITSISNWWTSSGSTTVSNLWSKTTEHASQLTTRLAQEQLDFTSKINTQTITELARNLQKIVVGETEEVLRIHLVHDLLNFSFLQAMIDQKFDQVFSSQVQGGIRVFSDQWGHPHKTAEKEDEFKLQLAGPQPKLNIFSGKITDGEKLAFANLENSIKLFQKAHEELMKQKEALSLTDNGIHEKNHDDRETHHKDRISDIFISILPIAIPTKPVDDNDIATIDPHQPGNFSFTIVLKDITNDISTITRSQSFPLKWVSWLEGDSEWKTKVAKEQEQQEQGDYGNNNNNNNNNNDDDDDDDVDPSDWVRDWVEDGLNVAFGVVAQNYVIGRMGF